MTTQATVENMSHDSHEMPKVSAKAANSSATEGNLPTLSEDYAEIGLGEEEGDYSTPAGENLCGIFS